MRLVTRQGIELAADEQVFLLYAALNAAGYAEEPKRRGPPLNAPVFHPIREKLRDGLRAARERPSAQAVQAVFETNQQPVALYIEAAMSLAPGGPAGSKPAAELARKLAPLIDFSKDAGLEPLFDELAAEQREHMKELKLALEKDLDALRKVIGDPSFRAPLPLVVVPNPLEGHGLVRRLTLAGTTYLVVGPGLPEARAAILEAALEPAMRALVAKHYDKGKGLARSWAALKTSKRITGTWPTGQAYLTGALTAAAAHRAMTVADKAAGREAEEEFIDAQAKFGMRWARVGLRLLDGSEPLESSLPKQIAKAQP